MIGGDSGAASPEGGIWERADRKVFCNGPYAMGFTSSFRMGQLLRYRLEAPIPSHDDLDDMDRFMATTFIDAVRRVLRDGGFAKVAEGQEEGGQFLVGIAGRLYDIGEAYDIGRNSCGYNAVGGGADLAFGSLHTTAMFDISPKDRIEYSLNAAAEFNTGVIPPFVVFNAPTELDL